MTCRACAHYLLGTHELQGYVRCAKNEIVINTETRAWMVTDLGEQPRTLQRTSRDEVWIRADAAILEVCDAHGITLAVPLGGGVSLGVGDEPFALAPEGRDGLRRWAQQYGQTPTAGARRQRLHRARSAAAKSGSERPRQGAGPAASRRNGEGG